jgi:hypothetical protein
MSDKNKNTDDEPKGTPDADKNAIDLDKYNSAVERARRFEAKLVDLEKKLEQYKDVDVDEYRAIKEDYQRILERSAGLEPDEAKALREQIEKEISGRFSSKVEELTTSLTAKERELKELRVKAPLTRMLANDFIPELIDLVTNDALKYATYEDGRVVIKNSNNEVRYSTANPQEPMKLEELVAELKEKYPSAVKSRVVSGGKGVDARGNLKSAKLDFEALKNNPEARANLSVEELREYARNLKIV